VRSVTTKQQLKEQKRFADENWQRIMNDVNNGIINRDDIAQAMELVNEVDRRIIEHNQLEILD
jgi:hypothetical protein